MQIVSDSQDKLNGLIRQLVQGPPDVYRSFIKDRLTYADLYSMAAHLRESLAGEKCLCLCTRDKALVLAATISALCGGPQLILPYTFSPATLEELALHTGYRYAIASAGTLLPAGVRRFVPAVGRVAWSPTGGGAPPALDARWMAVYTGGSTGVPQGWFKSVRNLLAETLRIVESYGISAVDCMVCTVSPLHIYGLLYAVLTPWVAWASVTDQTPLFPAEIEADVLGHGATILISAPAHYRALRAHRGAHLPLRLAFSSAGVLAGEDAHSFSERHGVGVTEVYGSTETGGVGFRNRFNHGDDFILFDPVRLKLKQEELWVHSDYLSAGLPVDSEGFYRIGDRAQVTAPNRFQLLGRSDSVVKVGGKRVDLEGVRRILKRHERVEEVVVTALPVGRSREQLIVALVQGEVDPVELLLRTSATLEPYARPRRIKVVEKIPVTAAGKFDRRTITAMFSDDQIEP